MRPEEPVPASHVILMCQPETLEGTAGDDSPLTAAGREAARAAARDMYGAGHHPGPLLVGDTAAGRETAAIMAHEVHLAPADIYYSPGLFAATTDMLEVEIRPLAVEFTLVTLVGYNPGVSELARILARDPRIPALRPGDWRFLRWPPPY